MTKNEAKTLKNGQKLYYLGLNYIVYECTVDSILEDSINNSINVLFTDGTEESFDDTDHKYIYFTKKQALEHAEEELNCMLNSIKGLLTNITQ